jgi:two-component system, OmpR family, sensor histidine kinase CiaH
MKFSPRSALALFLFMVTALFAQAVWWIVFMARLTAEKVDMARSLGGSPEYVENIHRQEISRQMMVGTEGVFFLVLILVGAWLIYRALVRTEELKFHQQNFLMAVTHELKTPLASIKLYVDTLQSPKIGDDRKEKVLPRMKEDIQRLERLVENILDAGRFERHGYRLNRTDIDLSALVEARVELLSHAASVVPVSVTKEIAQNIEYSGDPAALGRAIDAILENSLKYHDGKSASVHVTMTDAGRLIVIAVTDKGIGFDAKESRSLFERFYRIGNEMTRSQSGSGLGLYLCREIVRAHGGDVTAVSPGPGRGATFTITLKKS